MGTESAKSCHEKITEKITAFREPLGLARVLRALLRSLTQVKVSGRSQRLRITLRLADSFSILLVALRRARLKREGIAHRFDFPR
jgi:hypothetical protein